MASRVGAIVGGSIAVHAAIAIWALCGDPIVDRPVLAASSGRVFEPDRVRDDVVAEYVFDATSMPAIAPPAPAPAAQPVPQPARPAPAHPRSPSRLAEPPPSAEAIVDGLFADDRGLAPGGDLARRHPGADLAHQLDVARRTAGTATIGGETDPRLRGDDRARLGTAPDCACEPDPTPHVPNAPPRDVVPPTVHVDAPRAAPATTLTPDDVLHVITTAYLAGLERCQRQLAQRGADATGRITLDLSIDGDGAISAAAADGIDGGLDRCVEARAAGWRFPAPRDPASGTAITARYRVSLALQSP